MYFKVFNILNFAWTIPDTRSRAGFTDVNVFEKVAQSFALILLRHLIMSSKSDAQPQPTWSYLPWVWRSNHLLLRPPVPTSWHGSTHARHLASSWISRWRGPRSISSSTFFTKWESRACIIKLLGLNIPQI